MATAQLTSNWRNIGSVDAKRLAQSRLEAHWAAQLASAFGTTLHEPCPGDAHTNLEWLEGHDALASRPVGDYRAALRVADLSLMVLRGNDAIVALELEGQTVESGLAWLSEAAQTSYGTSTLLAWGNYQLPERAAGNAPFAVDRTALGELTRWFSSSNAMLREFAARHEGASEVRCWPHHFDIATLLTLDPPGMPDGRTVGVGMTPGDTDYAEPYFYVTPWPYPRIRSPGDLPLGHWHTEGWFGAVLTQSELLASEREQHAAVARFIEDAATASRELVGK